MAFTGRQPRLRDLFDESPTPHIAHPPRTHRRDFYVATDGSFSDAGGGLGVILETRSGDRVARLSVPDDAPDNNVAEYRALHLGLDVLAARAPPGSRVGVLVDHDDLAANVNAAILAANSPDYAPIRPITVPDASRNHWRGIRARLVSFEEARAARVASDRNPAHPLANSPDEYGFVNDQPAVCPLPDASDTADGTQIPPPSRADRNASD